MQVRSDTVTVAGPPLLTSVNTRHQVIRCSMPCVVVLDVVSSNPITHPHQKCRSEASAKTTAKRCESIRTKIPAQRHDRRYRDQCQKAELYTYKARRTLGTIGASSWGPGAHHRCGDGPSVDPIDTYVSSERPNGVVAGITWHGSTPPPHHGPSWRSRRLVTTQART